MFFFKHHKILSVATVLKLKHKGNSFSNIVNIELKIFTKESIVMEKMEGFFKRKIQYLKDIHYYGSNCLDLITSVNNNNNKKNMYHAYGIICLLQNKHDVLLFEN